jgi:hypothetical protein
MAERPITRLDYCQFLLSSQINYTLTHFADHAQAWSHDTVGRYLRGDRITPRLVWENVRDDIDFSDEGFLVFDDTVLDKRHSRQIEAVRRQYSGNAKAIIRGIGLVTCVYVNPETDRFWVIDYRIFAPDEDGKTKVDHVRDMLTNAVHQKRLPFRAVLMDAWYAALPIMLQVERSGKLYYCPMRCNRRVSEDGGPYERIDALAWTPEQEATGRVIHLAKSPRGHRVRLFRLVFSTERTEYVVTNDVAGSTPEAAREACGSRWRIEQFHREAKQVTGMERCQCRSSRIQRNHIGCAVLVWVRLKAVAEAAQQTIYRVKHGLLSDYLIQQLRSPAIKMALA